MNWTLDMTVIVRNDGLDIAVSYRNDGLDRAVRELGMMDWTYQ